MTREDIHNEIANLLKLMEINNNRMTLNDATLEIDLEQMKEHILRLYSLRDQLELLEDEEIEPSMAQESNVSEVEKEPEVALEEEPVVEDVPEPEPEPEPIPEEPKPISTPPRPRFKPEPVVPEPEPQPEPVVEEVPQTMEEVKPKVEVPQIKEPAPEPVANKKEEKKAAKTEAPAGDVYERLRNTKIESIKKGISISKRYEIQNELFGNDPQVYNDSINTLDNASGLDEALDYLEKTLMAKHKWDEEDSLVEELKTLLVRRYM